MSASSVIALRGLSKRYGDVVALEGLDLEVAAGECVALIGHNGSGKTTTMRLAAGQLEPTSGSVTVAGIDIHRAPDAHRARAALAFVPDTPLLYDDLTVAEHLELVGLAHGVGEALDERIDVLLDVLELRGRQDFLPVQLSRGMRQKTQLACTLAPRPVLARLRARRRAHRPPGQRSDRLIGAYGAVLYVVIGVVIAFRLLRQQPASGAASAWLTSGGLARIGAATLLLGLLAALRHATWQGPVVFRLPDVQWLLSAPIDRGALVRLRLARALAAGVAAGALLGLGTFVLLEAELGVPARPLLAAALLGPAAMGLLGAALGWLVERSPAASLVVLRASPLVLAAAAVAALVPGGGAGARAVLWSGPWGWAVGPVVAAAGGSVPGWPIQAALLAAVAVAAALAAWSRAGAITTEELARRATARTGLAASLYSLDARGAAQARRRANRTLLGVRRVRLRRPRRRLLAIPWRDALALLRAPARLGWALVLGGAGVVAVAAEPDRRAVVAAAAVAGYLAAAQLIEPLRAEAD